MGGFEADDGESESYDGGIDGCDDAEPESVVAGGGCWRRRSVVTVTVTVSLDHQVQASSVFKSSGETVSAGTTQHPASSASQGDRQGKEGATDVSWCYYLLGGQYLESISNEAGIS